MMADKAKAITSKRKVASALIVAVHQYAKGVEHLNKNIVAIQRLAKEIASDLVGNDPRSEALRRDLFRLKDQARL